MSKRNQEELTLNKSTLKIITSILKENKTNISISQDVTFDFNIASTLTISDLKGCQEHLSIIQEKISQYPNEILSLVEAIRTNDIEKAKKISSEINLFENKISDTGAFILFWIILAALLL